MCALTVSWSTYLIELHNVGINKAGNKCSWLAAAQPEGAAAPGANVLAESKIPEWQDGLAAGCGPVWMKSPENLSQATIEEMHKRQLLSCRDRVDMRVC